MCLSAKRLWALFSFQRKVVPDATQASLLAWAWRCCPVSAQHPCRLNRKCICAHRTCRSYEAEPGALLARCRLEAAESDRAFAQRNPGLKSTPQCFTVTLRAFIGIATVRVHCWLHTQGRAAACMPETLQTTIWKIINVWIKINVTVVNLRIFIVITLHSLYGFAVGSLL